MTCDLCGRPLSTKRDVVVFLARGGHRCFPCWIAAEHRALLWEVRSLFVHLAYDRLWREAHP